MPGLLPIILAGSYIVLAADRMPELNIEPSCRAAAATGLIGRDAEICKRDEKTARDKLEHDWGQFNDTQRSHCLALSTAGGPASYVELLTCLELAKAASELPADSRLNGGALKPLKR
jgi:hypothetical protein